MKFKKSSSVINQYIATICVNIITFSCGNQSGWLSANLVVLQSDSTPLESGPVTTLDASWIGSTLCLGGLIGNTLFGWLANRFGRKKALILIGVPQLLSWIVLIFAKNVTHLCIARFLSGCAGGGVFILIPLYITEISEERTRGFLGSLLVFLTNGGILLAFILGNYSSYYNILYICLIFPIFYFVGTFNLPETPQYLLKERRENDAEKSLRFYRNLKYDALEPEKFTMELQNLKVNFLENSKSNEKVSLKWSDFTNRAARKAIIIGIALMALNQFCGCYAMLNYSALVFQQAGSNLTPNMSSMIIAIIQLIGSYISTLLVERAGRKFLLTISALGTCFGLFTFGLFTQLTDLGYDLSDYRWIPLASFSCVIFMASWGVLTLPYVVISEIMPSKIRSVASIFLTNLLWFLTFLMMVLYPTLLDSIGMSACMFIFATCSLSGAVFILIFVPETKGKSFETIYALLDK